MWVNQDTLPPALMDDLSFSCAACITGVIVSRLTPSFPAARVSGACKLYSFVLDLRRPEKLQKITPVMQAEGNPLEKMPNFFRERLCIWF